MSVPNFLIAKKFATGTNSFSSENPTEINRSSKSFTSKSSWLHAEERRQGNSTQMQRDSKSLVKRNNPESWKTAVLMPEACICGCTAVIRWIHMEIYFLKYSKHRLMLHNKAEVQLHATITLMRSKIILLQMAIPTKLLPFPIKWLEFYA